MGTDLPFFTYILQSESSGRYYIGSTDDLDRRVRQHNDPNYHGSKTTKRFKGPWKLVHFEEYETRGAAILREKKLKSWKSRIKISQLVESRQSRD